MLIEKREFFVRMLCYGLNGGEVSRKGVREG